VPLKSIHELVLHPEKYRHEVTITLPPGDTARLVRS
jgi:hypothetical protein